jgi:hypothetical protein
MGSSLNKIIEINASGRVLMACNAQNIWNPSLIEEHKRWVVENIIEQMKLDNVGVESLSKIMDEKIALLSLHLEKGIDLPTSVSRPDQIEQSTKNEAHKVNEFYDPENIPPLEQKKDLEPKKPTKSSSKGTDMPTKLSEERKPVKKLILEDCVQLGLISKKRAEYVITQMAGKQPAEAEKEVVVELRENLHRQVRRLIRKDKGGPWSSPKDQEELRLEILHTPTVRSVLFITRDILREREEWLERSHSSITGRIFGKKMTLDK